MMSSKMDVFSELARMQEMINEHGTESTVEHCLEVCRQYSDLSNRISAVQLTDYSLDRLFDAYCKASKAARKHNAAAIYFEYDLDNDWSAHFFVCTSYNPPSIGDDDWACEYESAIRTTGIYEFGQIYKGLNGFCSTDESTAATLYMISRTANALSTVVERKPHETLPICIGFHDQDPIHRLCNGG